MTFALLKWSNIFFIHNFNILKFLFCEWFVSFSSLICICKMLIDGGVIHLNTGIMVYREKKDAVGIWSLIVHEANFFSCPETSKWQSDKSLTPLVVDDYVMLYTKQEDHVALNHSLVLCLKLTESWPCPWWHLGWGHFWPQGHNLNRLGRGSLSDATYQISIV